jgi:hypothetical protein
MNAIKVARAATRLLASLTLVLLGRDSLNLAVPPPEFSSFPLALSFSLCETHKRLTGNTNFQDNLLNVLLNHSRDTQFQ